MASTTNDIDSTLHRQGSTDWRKWAFVLGALATATQLYLVWGFEVFPTVDGPAHTHLAYAMYEALRGDEFYGGLVEFNSKANPNVLTQGILVALMAVAPPPVAEKLWLTLYFISFALAGAYALSGINRKSLCLLPLLVFCSLSLPLAFGFYNFAFSTVILLSWFGYWWRHRDEFTARTVLAHAAFAAIAYLTHIFAFIATLLAIGTTGLATIIQQSLGNSRDGTSKAARWRRTFLTHAMPPLLGSLPGLIASFHFLFGRFGSLTTAGAANMETNVLGRLQSFLAGTSFAPYDNAELIAGAAFAPIVVASTLYLFYKSRKSAASIPLAVCFAAFLTLYLIMPHQVIVRWMPPRFQPLVFIVLLLWLAALIPATIKPAQWKLAGLSGLALVLLSAAIRLPEFARMDGYFREYASVAPHIRENSTLLGFRLNHTLHGHLFPSRLGVFLQAGSRIASMRHALDLKNYQGQAEVHPIKFRPGVGAMAALGGDPAVIAAPPRVDLMAYERETGRTIDYLIVYGFREAVEDVETLARFDAQLHGNYKLIHASQSSGFVRLYARSPDDPHAPGQ